MESASAKRVAVVAVHGIADQLPDQTVGELARLLCHGSDGAPRFVQGELQRILVPVARLEPGPCAPPTGSGTGAASPARQRPGSPSGFYQQQEADTPTAQPDCESPPDLGIALNDYLLGRLVLSEGDALYRSCRISLRHRTSNVAVDIHEMYWADLSRLGSGGVAALISLYRLFLNLSTLAADVVDQAALRVGGGTAWHLLQRLHAWLAWLMKGPAVLVQVTMLLLLLFGTAALVPATQQAPVLVAVLGLGGIALLALAPLLWLRTPPTKSRLTAFGTAATGLASLALAAFVVWDGRGFIYLYLGTSILLTTLAGCWLVRRYARMARGVWLLGHTLVTATALLLCWQAWTSLPFVTTLREWLLTSALGVGELQIAAILLVWAIFTVVQIAALILGFWLTRRADATVVAAMDTARLGLIGSTALFTVLSLVLWSVFIYVAGHSLDDLYYQSRIFDAGSSWPAASAFLDERVRLLGSFFTPLVVLSSLLGLAGLLVLAPALLEELAPTRNLDSAGLRPDAQRWTQSLGNWLGGGMHRLERCLRLLVPLGAIAGGILYLAFVSRQFAFAFGVGDGLVQTLSGWLEYFQGEALVTAGKWLAGGALTIAALGTRFSNTFGRLRVVIDAIMDVDNYFADPPDGQSPRARIFSRYASLLAYLREAGYDRIVIVSHSQGTVISAELLRYLHIQGRLQNIAGTAPLALVTVGSPLRDLYAKRFPLLYQWMGQSTPDFATARPTAADLGLHEWINACRSGDYVGRFIWSDATNTAAFRIAEENPATGWVNATRADDRSEFCLGAGGHTHYFSNDAMALGREIERLILGDR